MSLWFLVKLVPDLLAALFDLVNIIFKFLKSFLLFFLPSLILLIMSFFLLISLRLICFHLLNITKNTYFIPSIFPFFLSRISCNLLNSSSTGPLSLFISSISSSNSSFLNSHFYNLSSMLPELSAYLIFRFRRTISLFMLFYSSLFRSAVINLCSRVSRR